MTIQLTLEQLVFVLCMSTNVDFFFKSKYLTVESVDAELWIRRADCKFTRGFSTVTGGGVLAFLTLCCVVQGLTVL